MGAGALALLGHAGVKAGHVDLVACVLADLAREVDGEAVGVVQLEGNGAGKLRALLELGKGGLELGLAGVEGGVEALLLGAQQAQDEGLVLGELRVHVGHEAHDLGGVGGQEDALDAEQAAVVDRAAQQAAQHVAAALVGGQDAVADHERDGAAVVGHDAHRAVGRGVVAVGAAREALANADERGQDVAVVVGALVLHDGRDALEAHAGVNVAVRQVGKRAVLLAVVLREYEVPELEVAVAVIAGRLALELRALVEVDLGAGAAGAGGAGSPEVVVGAEAADVLVGHAVGMPELDGLVIVLEDGHVETVLGKAEVLLGGDELPRPRDGVGLGVAAEREVAEHLEEREVARVADVVDVVGAQALLAGARADLGHGLDALVVLLELVHARVREQKRRVVGHERRGRVELAALGLEELQEVVADLGSGHRLVVGHGARHSSAIASPLQGACICTTG